VPLIPFVDTADRPAPASRSSDLIALGLAMLALAAAAGAQAYLQEWPWVSVAGFVLGGTLLALAARRLPVPPDPAPAPPARLSNAFLTLFGAGISCCLAAAWLVYHGRAPRLTHAVWGVGLVLLAIAAWIGRTATRDQPAPGGAERTFSRRDTLLIGAGLALLALIVFGWDVTALPVEVHGDDAEVGLDAVRLLNNFNLFSAGWFELPRFHALPSAIGIELFGVNLLGLRGTSVGLGIGCVLLLFAVTRRLWNDEVALLAALLLITQRFFIHLSRAGYHYIDTPFLSLLVVWLLLRMWHDGRLGAAVWCGIALGLGIQTYYASRLVPVLLAVTWLSWLRGTPAPDRPRRTAAFLVIVFTAVAVAAPMFAYFAHDWSAFWERTRNTSMFSPGPRQHLAYGYHTDNLLTILLIQLRAAFSLFNLQGDNSVQYGLKGALFDPASATLLVLGAGLAIARLRERRSQLLLLWTLLPLIAGAALTIDTPFFPRISGLVPFAIILVALALWTLCRAARAAVPTRLGTWLVGALSVAALAYIGAENLRTYFVDYASRYRHSPCVEIAAWVRAHGAGKTTYMVGSAPGFYIRHGAISFLTYGYATRDVENLGPQHFDPATSVFVIMPHGTHILPELEQAVGPFDLQTHRNRDGNPAFLTAVPRNQADAALDPAERFDQPRQPPPGIAQLDRVLRAVADAAEWLLAGAAAVLVLAALIGWRRPPRRPGAAALRVPLRERAERWRAAAVGPHPREQRDALPPGLVVGLLLAVLAVAVGLRVYHLVDLPAGFFCDEAGNAYNAYSLLHTGRDETGARWPLYVWSFGVSYKNPIFIYSAMLPMALLGASELAVRLTAALYGSGAVLAMFFLGRELMGPAVGLIAALLLAVCPWHLHFSRIGFELIALPFFFTLAVWCLVRWTRGSRTLPQAMVLFGLCLYTYVPAKLIVPLFVAGFALLYWRALAARWRETAIAAGLLVLTAAPVAIFDVAHREQAGSYFRNTTLLALDQSPLELARTLVDNYAAFFSPEFLFERSNDRIIRHSVGEHGQLYPFFAPLLVLGALTAVLRRDRAMRLPLLWLALYPLAPALMNEIPSASRGIAGAPAFCVVAAIGAGALLRLPALISRRRAVVFALQGALVLAGLAAVVPAVREYWRLYRDEYPLYAAKYYTGFQYGHRQVIKYFRDHYDEYDLQLLTTRKSNQPDIFLRFYDGLRQPPRTDIMPPFEHREKMMVGSADNYELYDLPPRHMLFAVLPEEVPLFADADVKDRVVAPDGSAAFVLVAASQLKDFVSTWMVNGLLPEDDHSRPPTWTPDTAPDGDAWRLYDKPAAGVGLNDFFTQNADHACAWAVNFVTTEAPRELRVFAGFDDTGEVWIDGRRVQLHPAGDDEISLVDAETGTLHLHAGLNTIAVRSCETVGDWRFFFRVENPDGTPAEGLTWEYGPRVGAPQMNTDDHG
jgi:4-amino-4-deoxy-L-arabinose transferase-like glycosyltransferase